MAGIILLSVIIIIGIGLYLLFTTQKKGKTRAEQPLIKISCKDGYIIGYYGEGARFLGKRYVNYKLMSEGTFVNGIQVGLGKEYYENGVLKYEGNFVSGLASGLGKLYEENGKLKYIGNFTNGYASGQGRIFDVNGKLKCEGNFERLPSHQENKKDPSVPSGRCKEYYENGQLKYEGDFLNGVWHGDGRSYDANGRLIFKGKFSYGKPAGK